MTEKERDKERDESPQKVDCNVMQEVLNVNTHNVHTIGASANDEREQASKHGEQLRDRLSEWTSQSNKAIQHKYNEEIIQLCAVHINFIQFSYHLLICYVSSN